VSVFQHPDLSVETRVDGAGHMTYPFLGSLDVGGKTPAQIEALLAAGLEEKQILKRPQVTVNVVQFRSQQVAVLGQVNRPGKFPLELPYTVSDVLALAGGVTPNGADAVVLSRLVNGAVINQEIDLVQMFTPNGKRAADVPVLPGDVLYVHRAPLVYIYGEVQRPGPMRLERDMTVLQALSTGGGLTLRGSRRGVVITRKVPEGGMKEISADLETLLKPEDVIYVRESWF
jgi:polysaccharide export outer membrane protein